MALTERIISFQVHQATHQAQEPHTGKYILSLGIVFFANDAVSPLLLVLANATLVRASISSRQHDQMTNCLQVK